MTEQQTGYNTLTSIGWESTYGTAITTGYKMPVNSNGIKKTVKKNHPGTITGRRDRSKPFKGNIDVSGPITVPMDTEALWYWLYAMFWDGVSAGWSQAYSDPLYTHTFVPQVLQGSFTEQKAFSDVTEFFYTVGNKITGFSISVGGDTNTELIMSIDTMGSDGANVGSTVFSSAETTVSLGERLNISDASIEIDTVESSRISDLTLKVDFGHKGTRLVGGGGKYGKLPPGFISVSGSFTSIFDDAEIIDIAAADTEVQLELIFTPSVNSTHILTFDMEEIELEEETPIINGGEDGILVNSNFYGYFDNGSNNTSLKVTQINTVDHS